MWDFSRLGMQFIPRLRDSKIRASKLVECEILALSQVGRRSYSKLYLKIIMKKR